MNKRELTTPLQQSRGIVPIALVALLALGLRLTPLLRSGVDWAMLWDARDYVELADGLRAGCGFARLHDGACGLPELLRTPGYPLFLAVMPSVRWALAAQAVLGAMVCLLTGLLIRNWWSLSAALVGEALVAFDIPSISWSAVVMSDVLFQFLVLIAVASAMLAGLDERRHRQRLGIAVAAGVATAGAIMVRPIGECLVLLIPLPLLCITALPWRRRIHLACAVAIFPLLVIGGWTVRNHRATGFTGISTSGIYNLYYYEAANTLAYASGRTLEDVRQELRSLQQNAPVERMGTYAWRVIRAHPMPFLFQTGYGIIYTAIVPDRTNLAEILGFDTAHALQAKSSFHDGRPTLDRFERRIASIGSAPIVLGLVLFQLGLCLLLWVGVARALLLPALRSWQSGFEILYPLSVALALLLLGSPVSTSRMRVPAIPLLAMVAAVGWCSTKASRRKQGGEQRPSSVHDDAGERLAV